MRVSLPQSDSEEMANAVSHGFGIVLAAAALPVLLASRGPHDRETAAIGACVFCMTMLLLYLASTLYHACPPGRAKNWLNRADQAVIYLFIAGSYTPFAIGWLRDERAWCLFGLVWTVAALGFVVKLFDRLKHPLWSTGLYVAMGWIAVIAATPFLLHASDGGLTWLIFGAVSYTVGAAVFVFDDRVRYAHCLWHLFVLGGSTCHLVAVLRHIQ